MRRYFEKEHDASAFAIEVSADPRVALARAIFEPYNGWFVTIVPHYVDCSDLADQVEVQDGVRRSTPSNRKPFPKLPEAPASAGEGAKRGAPSKGATAKVWQIADELHNSESGPLVRSDRPRVIAACVEQGINKATASTQWSRWAKARGV